MAGVGPKHGDLWYAQLSPVVGHEQGGPRPVLIVSGDRLNSLPSDIVAILPLTSRDRGLTWHYRLEVGATGLSNTSFVVCEQLRTIGKKRLRRYVGEVEPDDLHQIMEIVYWMLS